MTAGLTNAQSLTTCASMSRYTGYKPNNASSGLKHWGIHEHVGRPLVDDVDWAVAPVKQAVWLVLEIFNNNGVFGRLLLEIC